MRAILLLLTTATACGNKGGVVNQFELDIGINAPQASSALIDGTVTLQSTGVVYSRGFASLAAARSLQGTVATVNADGTVRASLPYQVGSYCDAVTPLIRETQRYVESATAAAPALALDSVECERADGTGSIVKP